MAPAYTDFRKETQQNAIGRKRISNAPFIDTRSGFEMLATIRWLTSKARVEMAIILTTLLNTAARRAYTLPARDGPPPPACFREETGGRRNRFFEPSWLNSWAATFLAALCACEFKSACDLCAVYNAEGAKGGSGAGFSFTVAEQFIDANTTRYEGTKFSPDQRSWMRTSVTQSGGPGMFVRLSQRNTLNLQAAASFEALGRDAISSRKSGNTGGESWFAGPRLAYTRAESLAATLGVDIPLRIENNGLQVVPAYRLHAGVTVRF